MSLDSPLVGDEISEPEISHPAKKDSGDGGFKPSWLILIIVVLSILFLGTLIGLIIVASRSSSDSDSKKEDHSDFVTFTEYTALVMSYHFHGDMDFSKMHSGGIEYQTVYDDFKYSIKSVKDLRSLEETSRLYSKGDDDMLFICMHLLGHDNCFVRSFGAAMGFHIPYYADHTASHVPCTDIAVPISPYRNFTFCDQYSVGSGSSLVQFIVESDSGYPVEERVTTFAPSGPYTVSSNYITFTPGKPQEDESLFKTYEGVTVYDFRNGKGDSGNGGSNVYEEGSSLNDNVEGRRGSKDKVASLFDALKSKDKLSHNQAVRDFLHVQLAFSPVSSLPAYKGPKRAIRDDIPESFDAREQWPNCSSISTITNQGMCGSCWAMSSTGTLSDRACVLQGNHVQLSPQYLMECSYNNRVCQGGTMMDAWGDLIQGGTVPESCVPFKGRYGDCPSRCEDGTLIDDTIKVAPKSFVMPWANSSEERVKAIQSEIMTNGPVQGMYWFFSDFQLFFQENPKGIYHRSPNAVYLDGHAIRIIGWGTQNGEDYWLVANSYGTSWGDGGYFKMRRGNNECNFEEQVAAGLFVE